MDQTKTHVLVIDEVYANFESCYEAALELANEIDSLPEARLSAKRTLRFNSSNETASSAFPEYAKIFQVISSIIEEQMKKISPASQPDAPTWILLGNCYLSVGDFPNALTSYDRAHRLYSDTTDKMYWYAFGVVFHHFRYYDHARKCYEKILTSNESFEFSDDLLFRSGILFRKKDEFERALTFFARSLENPPRHLTKADVQFQIAYTYQLAHNFEKAGQIYLETLELYPTNVQLKQQHAWFQYMISTSPYALELFIQPRLEQSPSDPFLLMIAGRLAHRKSDYQRAFEFYRECSPFWNGTCFFWYVLGLLYFRSGDLKNSIGSFQKAISYNQEIDLLWLNLGYLFEMSGDTKAALETYKMSKGKLNNVKAIESRIALLEAPRGVTRPADLVEVPEGKFMIDIPEAFAFEYSQSVPPLPASCFGLEGKKLDFSLMSTVPPSLFL